MRYIKVTVVHQPDAGQHSSRRFTYPELLCRTDEATAREFAFKALAEDGFQKGLITVNFPEASGYSFWFERTGLVGYELTRAQGQRNEPQFV